MFFQAINLAWFGPELLPDQARAAVDEVFDHIEDLTARIESVRHALSHGTRIPTEASNGIPDTNPFERLNGEIKRRSEVGGLQLTTWRQYARSGSGLQHQGTSSAGTALGRTCRESLQEVCRSLARTTKNEEETSD
jgi:hypothetical protein